LENNSFEFPGAGKHNNEGNDRGFLLHRRNCHDPNNARHADWLHLLLRLYDPCTCHDLSRNRTLALQVPRVLGRGRLYRLARPYWRRGHATEASRAFIDLAFTRLDLVRLSADVEKGNAASEHILQEGGFKYLSQE